MKPRDRTLSTTQPEPRRRGRGSVAAALVLLAAGAARGDRLDQVRARGELIWGADQEGGGPYVYTDERDPDRLVGFEVELAALLAEHLGVKPRFQQADWSTLPAFLEKGEIDIILNGYEWTPTRAARMLASRPYYIYKLQLLARQGDDRIRGWDDLTAPPGQPLREVSVLVPSAAYAYLDQHLRGKVEIVQYDGNTNAMRQVAAGVHDATLQDLPIAVFFRNRPQGAGLRFVGEPVGRGYYVAYARAGETRLAAELNAAIESAVRDGRLRRIYDKYGLWDAAQEGLLDADPAAEAEAEASSALSDAAKRSAAAEGGAAGIARFGPKLLAAAWITIKLSVLAMPLAMLVGLLVALGRQYGPLPVRAVAAVWVEVLRGTPVMLQLYLIYFLMPRIWQGLWEVSLDPMAAAVIGLAVNYSAYEAEIYRAGLQAIPRGQMEAALALGMSGWTALRRVIVPQAVRIVVPPVTNDFIALFKDTSICSVIAVVELTKTYNVLVNNTGRFLELAAMTALLYLAMSFPLSVAARRMERRLSGESQAAPA